MKKIITFSVIYLCLYLFNNQTLKAQTFIIGSDSTSNFNTGYPAGYGNWYFGARQQFLYYGSELTAEGASPGNISEFGFNVLTINAGVPLDDFTIKMKNTTDTNLTAFDNADWITVYYASSYVPVIGWNNHNLSTPFFWDGTSNILVEVCFNNTNYVYNESTEWTESFPNTVSLIYRADAPGVCVNNAISFFSNNRPNALFKFPVTNDVGVIDFISPVSGCELTANDSIRIKIKNFGLTSQVSFVVQYQNFTGPIISDIVTDTILPGDTLTFTFSVTQDLSLEQAYTFYFATLLVTDGDTFNDTLSKTIVHIITFNAFPAFENFETFTPGNPGILLNGWRNTGSDNFDWYVGTGPTPTFGTGPQEDHTTGFGNYMYIGSNWPNYPDKTAILESPCIDISALAVPTLKFWYHMFGLNMGTLYIDIYSGGTWNLGIGSVSGDQGNLWFEKEIDLSPFAGIIQMRFRAVTDIDWTSDIAIDDIIVYDKPADDVGVIAIDAPVSACGLTAAESVTIRVKNLGYLTQDTIPVGYQVNGGGYVYDTIFGLLNSGDTVTFIFDTTVDLSAEGVYNFEATTGLTGDTVYNNDTVSDYRVFHGVIQNVCIYDVPGGNGGCGFTKNMCFDGNAVENTLQTSSPFLLNTPGIYAIDFYLFYTSCAVPGDTTNFTFYLNNVPIGTFIDSSFECGFCIPNQGTYPFKFTITDSILINSAYNCNGFINTLSVINDGLSMNISGYAAIIYADCPPALTTDVGVVSIDAPSVSGCGLTANENVTVSITNFGGATQNNIPVSFV